MNNNPSRSITAIEGGSFTTHPLDGPVAEFESALDQRQSNRLALIHWIKHYLVEGVDFGSIKTKRGLTKPSLWKAGAEKINTMLSISAQFPSYAGYEQAALDQTVLEHIIIRCELINAQQVIVASGIGARALKQDYNDLNKALKMASKSAYIDATLKLAGLSDIFTLDLEDMLPEQLTPDALVCNSKAHSASNPELESKPAHPELKTISEQQLTVIQNIVVRDRIHPEKLLNWLSRVCEAQGYPAIQQLSQLPVVLLDQVMKRLPEFANTAEE